MNYKFYTTSTSAWRAMLAAIRQAKKSVYWESYIFIDNIKQIGFIDALARKARAGVAVKMIVDSFGSFFLRKEVINKLRRAGVEVLFYNRLIPWWNPVRFKHWWLHRNHKKLLIIDKKTAFIGGVNVSKRMRNWLDLQIELRGMAARYLVKSFVVSYRLSGGRDEIKYAAVLRKSKIKIFHQSPLTEKSILKAYYQKAVKTACKSVLIVTPYFFPQSWLIKVLGQAVKRKVKVEIILPEKSDYRLADLFNYCLASLVWRPGITFFFSRRMNHAKAILVDGREAMVGSQNIDTWSFNYNLEGGVIFSDKEMIRRLKIIVGGWKRQSRKLVFANSGKKWYQKLIAAVVFWLVSYF